MPDLGELLQQYYDIVQELRQVEERKHQLREQIKAAIQQQGGQAELTIHDTLVNATVRSSVKVEYDEAGLRQRLGEKYHTILTPDPKKVVMVQRNVESGRAGIS